MTKEVTQAKKEVSEFAIIETGGKQYRVSAGDNIKIEKIADGMNIGDKLTFDKVLLTDNGTDTSVGAPYISGAKVQATVKDIARHAKVVVVKYLQKSRYHKKNGHKQPYFEVTIDSIK